MKNLIIHYKLTIFFIKNYHLCRREYCSYQIFTLSSGFT